MMSYREASQYIEDNTYNKTEKCENRYYCGECKKTSNWTEYSGGNGIENWSELNCDNCGAGVNMTKKQYWEEIYSCMYSMWIEDFPQELKDKVEQKVKEVA